LAVHGGIVAIPIANIEEVDILDQAQPNAVRIAVRNPATIQPLLRVKPAGTLGGDASGGLGTVESARDGDTVTSDRKLPPYYIGVTTCTTTDTDTFTGGQGQLDAIDDVNTEQHVDDTIQ
jgi:hypothetical protein